MGIGYCRGQRPLLPQKTRRRYKYDGPVGDHQQAKQDGTDTGQIGPEVDLAFNSCRNKKEEDNNRVTKTS